MPIRFGGSKRHFGHKVGRRESLKTDGCFPLDKLEEVVLQWQDKMPEKPRAEKCNLSLRTLPLIDTGREENVPNRIGKLEALLPLCAQGSIYVGQLTDNGNRDIY